MNQITVFGASGRTGKLFTELALNNGYQVKALVRNPSKFDLRHSNLLVVQGDIADPTKLEETIRGTEAVIDLAGSRLIDLVVPGKAPPPDLKRTATQNILSSMQQNKVERLIIVDSLPNGLVGGILDSNDQPGFMNKWFINKFTIFIGKKMLGQLLEVQRAYVDLIKQSPVRWTILRAPTLSDQPSKGNYRLGYLDADTGKVASRSDVAAFLLDVLMNGKYVEQMPLISS
jgi:nucleoside-diphosphate-sugar epimerase